MVRQIVPMDFVSLLDKAQHNAKKVTKDLSAVHSEMDSAKRKELHRIEQEKRRRLEDMKKRKREAELQRPPPEPEPKKKQFQIPKVKNSESTVDKSRIASFLAKKEEEKRNTEKQKQIERDRLAQLRLQANGGKANKKIARHFGMDPINLQIRYGSDHQHIEELKKRQERELEEQERLADSYRNGVHLALQQKKKVEEVVRKKGNEKKEPHRVATSKANSLAGLSARHAAHRDHFSPPPDSKKKEKERMEKDKPKKRPPPPVAIDFGQLMRQAEAIAQGKTPPRELPPVPAPVPEKRPRLEERASSSRNGPCSSTSRFDEREKYRLAPEVERKPTHSHSMPSSKSNSSRSGPPGKPASAKDLARFQTSSSSSSKPSNPPAVAKEKEKKKEGREKGSGRFVKGPTPPPSIPPPVPGKRYLPGDIRYQMLAGSNTAPIPQPAHVHQREREKMPPPSATRMRVPDRDREKVTEKLKTKETATKRISSFGRERQRAMEREKEKTNDMAKKRREAERQKRYERMSLVDRERMREYERRRQEMGMHSDLEEDELDDEEYDSDMDDFIDDSLDVDDLSRLDFEDVLRSSVNKNYDKKKWQERERMIDDRRMEADYRTITKEEQRSKRLGLLEDIKEARKGNSEAL